MYAPSPYGGYQQPANPYAAPAPSPYQPYTPPPVSDPYGGYLGAPVESAVQAPPPAPLPVVDTGSSSGMPPPPRLIEERKPAKNKTKSGPSSCSAVIKLLPLGAGQFCYGSPIKGVFFAGSESASLYFYYVNSTAAKTYAAIKTKNHNEREAARVDQPVGDVDAYDAETDAADARAKTAIGKATQNAQYSIISFGGLWAIGVVDAFVNGSPRPKASKRKSPRILHSYNLDLRRAPMGTFSLALPYESSLLASQTLQGEAPPTYFIGYTPMRDSHHNNLIHSMSIGIELEL